MHFIARKENERNEQQKKHSKTIYFLIKSKSKKTFNTLQCCSLLLYYDTFSKLI